MSIAIKKYSHGISSHPKQRSILDSMSHNIYPFPHKPSFNRHRPGLHCDICSGCPTASLSAPHRKKSAVVGIFLANPTVDLGAAHRLPITIESQSFNLHRPRSHRAFRGGGPIVDSARAHHKYPLPAKSHNAIPAPSGHL